MEVNICILKGDLTRDPTLTYTSASVPICRFTLAVNQKIKDRAEVSFFDIVVCGKLAKACTQHIEKGRSVLINGRLKQDRWGGNDGQKRSRVVIIASTVTFLDSEKYDESAEPAYEDAPERSNSGDIPFLKHEIV